MLRVISRCVNPVCPLLSSCRSFAKCTDCGGIILLAEHRGARDQDVGARIDYPLDGSRSDAAVYLQLRLQAALCDPARELLDLRQASLDEALSAETRVDGHDQDHIHAVEHIFEVRWRRRRVQDRKSTRLNSSHL